MARTAQADKSEGSSGRSASAFVYFLPRPRLILTNRLKLPPDGNQRWNVNQARRHMTVHVEVARAEGARVCPQLRGQRVVRLSVSRSGNRSSPNRQSEAHRAVLVSASHLRPLSLRGSMRRRTYATRYGVCSHTTSAKRRSQYVPGGNNPVRIPASSAVRASR